MMLLGKSTATSLAVFAGGASVGILAARLLPPLAAQLAGSAMGRAGGDPFEILVADHQAFLSLLTDMEDPNAGGFTRGQLLLRLKRRLAKHALAEEDIVYPLLHDDAERAEHVKQLYAEHAEIKMLLHGLEHTPLNRDDWAEKASALKKLITSHADQEEQEEFPRLRTRLDDVALSRLFGEVEREKSLIL